MHVSLALFLCVSPSCRSACIQALGQMGLPGGSESALWVLSHLRCRSQLQKSVGLYMSFFFQLACRRAE